MAERVKLLLDEFIAGLPDDCRSVYRDIAEYAISLGYTPKRVKPQGYIAFSKSKVKRTIMKMTYWNECLGRQDMPGILLKFYSNQGYSELFQQGVKKVIEHFGGKYTGCYGCGRCKGALEGYTYRYPDGKEVFKCGFELVELPPVGERDIPEIKELLRVQDGFFVNQSTAG